MWCAMWLWYDVMWLWYDREAMWHVYDALVWGVMLCDMLWCTCCVFSVDVVGCLMYVRRYESKVAWYMCDGSVIWVWYIAMDVICMIRQWCAWYRLGMMWHECYIWSWYHVMCCDMDAMCDLDVIWWYECGDMNMMWHENDVMWYLCATAVISGDIVVMY